jgi:hypothetical protein
MNMHLVVVRAFAAYRKGDTITDTATMTAILASEHAPYVVRVIAQGG